MPQTPLLLEPACVRAHAPAQSRKRALEIAAGLLAARHPGLAERALLEEFLKREDLGSTGIGEGVAIPHCRIDCPAVVAALISLDAGIDYEAIDDQPVDLLFVLVVPTAETDAHLNLLATLAGIFSEASNRRSLRAETDDLALWERMQELLAAAG